jgi:hypothetical protein
MKKITFAVIAFATISFCADSLNVRLLGRFTATSPQDVTVRDGIVYVANSGGGLQVLDASDPSSISELGYRFLPGNATGITKLGEYFAIACSDSAVRILDASDPSDIGIVGEFASDAGIFRCCAVGETVFTNGERFKIISAEDPAAMWQIGEFTSVFAAEGLDVEGNYAYLCEKNYGLSVVKISNPSSPSNAGRYLALTGYVHGVDADRHGNVFVAANAGIYIYEHHGDSLRQIGFWASPNFAYDVVASFPYAYVACGSAGFRILNISNPSAITEVGYYVLGSDFTDGYVDYPIAWLSGQWSRLNAFDISPFEGISERKPKTDFLEFRAYPNPFNSALIIDIERAFDFPDVSICDVSGREIIKSAPKNKINGGSEFTWVPSQNVHSGIYFVKICDGKSVSKKAVLYLK